MLNRQHHRTQKTDKKKRISSLYMIDFSKLWLNHLENAIKYNNYTETHAYTPIELPQSTRKERVEKITQKM